MSAWFFLSVGYLRPKDDLFVRPDSDQIHHHAPMAIRDLLGIPALYEWYQRTFGFAGARAVAFERYLPISTGELVLDIGCGPGNIIPYFPQDVRVVGFDTDSNYIAMAKSKYGARAEFHCREFDDACADEFAGADVVMMNGLLHHLNDNDATSVVRCAQTALRPGGRLFTLDGVYTENQRIIARKLLDFDRGRFVRHQNAYENLIRPTFDHLDAIVANDLTTIPYTFLIMIATKAGATST